MKFYPLFGKKWDDEKAALAGIEAYEAFLRAIGMPTNLQELGLELTEAQLDELAWRCSFEGTRTIGLLRKLELSDMKEIYRLAQ